MNYALANCTVGWYITRKKIVVNQISRNLRGNVRRSFQECGS